MIDVNADRRAREEAVYEPKLHHQTLGAASKLLKYKNSRSTSSQLQFIVSCLIASHANDFFRLQMERRMEWFRGFGRSWRGKRMIGQIGGVRLPRLGQCNPLICVLFPRP